MKLIIKDSYDTFREMKKQVDTLIIGTAFGDDVDAKEDKDINPYSFGGSKVKKDLKRVRKNIPF